MIQHSDPNNYEFSVEPICGLGNRLLVLSAGIRFLNKGYFKSMKVCWRPSEDLLATIEDVLTLDGPITYGLPYPEGTHLPLQNMPNTVRVPITDKINVCHFATFRSSKDDPDADLTNEWKEALKSIHFRRDLTAIADTIDVSDRIGIHCRRSDFWAQNHETAARCHVKLDRFFVNYLKSVYPDKKFFLATDSPYTLINFEEGLGDQIIHFPKTSYPIWRTRNSKSVKEAVVDMILLSRCSSIIADSDSTFSLVASWLGNIEKTRWQIPKT